MKPIQFVVGAGFIALGFLFQVQRRSLGRALSRLGLLFFISAAIVAILFPNIFDWFAELFGVGRGADLLTYMTTFCAISFIFLILGKIKQIERDLTLVAREVALISVERKHK